jgi:hypothetical protein
MKKVIISIYVAIVITVSLLAQASFASQDVELHGAYVVLSKDASKLLVLGRYPNPCTANAEIDLVPVQADTLVIQVRAVKQNDACIALLGNSFKIVRQVATLKEKLAALSMDPNGTYNVVTADGRFSETIDFSQAVETERTSDFTTMINSNVVKSQQVINL